MTYRKRTTWKWWGNRHTDPPKKWKLILSSVSYIAIGAVPIVGNIRGLSENLQHDISTVYLPMLALIARGISFCLGEEDYISMDDGYGGADQSIPDDMPNHPLD